MPKCRTDGCHATGIIGACGPECYVYLDGECSEPGEMIARLEGDCELARHEELYGKAESDS